MPDAPVIPIAQPPEPSAPDTSISASSIMSRFDEMKKNEAAAATPPPEPTPAKPEVTPKPEVEPPTPTPETEPEAAPAKAKWGELKAKATKADELEKTLAQKEQELADLREKAAKFAEVDPERYEKQIAEKEKQIAEYEKKVAITDVRESKQFKSEVIEPMSKIGFDMDRLAATYKISARDLKDALTIADPAEQFARLNELTAEFDPLHKAKVWTAAEKTLELYDLAAKIEANAAEARKEAEFIQHQETEKQKQEREKQLSLAQNESLKMFKEKIPYLFSDESVASKISEVDLSLNQHPQWQAYRALAGNALPIMHDLIGKKDARIAELEGELAKRSSVSVKAGGTNGSTPPPDSSVPVYEGSTVFERAKHAAALGHISAPVRRL